MRRFPVGEQVEQTKLAPGKKSEHEKSNTKKESHRSFNSILLYIKLVLPHAALLEIFFFAHLVNSTNTPP